MPKKGLNLFKIMFILGENYPLPFNKANAFLFQFQKSPNIFSQLKGAG